MKHKLKVGYKFSLPIDDYHVTPAIITKIISNNDAKNIILRLFKDSTFEEQTPMYCILYNAGIHEYAQYMGEKDITKNQFKIINAILEMK